MSPLHIGAGLVVGGLVIASVVALELYTPPDAQRLLVKNEYADAKCTMQFAMGAFETFSVRKDAEHRKTYKALQPGFIIARCQTAERMIDLPNSFHLMIRAKRGSLSIKTEPPNSPSSAMPPITHHEPILGRIRRRYHLDCEARRHAQSRRARAARRLAPSIGRFHPHVSRTCANARGGIRHKSCAATGPAAAL